MFVGKHYLPAIKALKRGETLYIIKTDERSQMVANRIVSLGFAVCRSVDLGETGVQYYLKPVHNQANPTPSAPQQHVQVQWWLSGARQGAYSQETYSVIESDNKWTAFHDALGRKHVVATDRVRFVASRKEQKAQVAA